MGSLGAGDLYIASEMAGKLDFRPGLKVLELGAGNCLSSVYFGTDDLYPSYLTSFLKPGGKLCIASPCYKNEIGADTPKYLLYDPPEYKKSPGCHSPKWWYNHFNKIEKLEIVECEEHPKGRIF